VALVYVFESPRRKGRISKAIRQCCAIDDAFCLTAVRWMRKYLRIERRPCRSRKTNRNKVVARLERDGWVAAMVATTMFIKNPARPGRMRTASPHVIAGGSPRDRQGRGLARSIGGCSCVTSLSWMAKLGLTVW